MKELDDEVKLDTVEVSMCRWMTGFKLEGGKRNAEITELLGLKPVSLVIKNGKSRWFGLVEFT